MKRLKVFTNSQLVTKQAWGEYEAWDPTLMRYPQKPQALKLDFYYFKIFHILRSENAWIDTLS